nr:MAG TPA: hypothetical protein [Caudoviricetes sp.]
MDDKIKKIIFNYNLQIPCNLYDKYIIKQSFYTRMIVCFGFKNSYRFIAEELYHYYIFLNYMDITRRDN